jgi:ATP-dependent DNA helicase RecG
VSSSFEALESIARPLRYASRNEFQNLATLRGLEGSLAACLGRLGASPDLGPWTERLASLIRGIDAIDHTERIRRIREMLALIDDCAAQLGRTGEVTRKERPMTTSGEAAGRGASEDRRSDRSPEPPTVAPLEVPHDDGAARSRRRGRRIRGGSIGQAGRGTESAAGAEDKGGVPPVGAKGDGVRKKGGAKSRSGSTARQQRASAEDAAAGALDSRPTRPQARKGVAPRADPGASGRGVEHQAVGGDASPMSEAKQPSPRSDRKKRVAPSEAMPQMPLASIAGVGPKTAERLAARGLVTVHDALLFVPRRYDDRRSFTPVAQLQAGVHATVIGEVAATGVRFLGRGRRVFEVAVRDESGLVSCRWFRFHPAAMEKRFERGRRFIVSGPVTQWGAMRQMVHPETELVDDVERAEPGGLVPVYGEIDGVPARTLRTILVELARGAAHRLADPLPEPMRLSLGLESLGDAVRKAHDPVQAASRDRVGSSNLEQPDGAASLRARLIFDELFFLQLALAIRRRSVEAEPGFVHAGGEGVVAIAQGMLPFALTRAQARALREIAVDLASARPMNRLLQGDVGSGKTAVAAVALAIAVRAGSQGALLVPTEILARQHLAKLTEMLADRARVALLVGSMREKERRALLADLARGAIDVLVGTHAILEDDVVFSRLGLGVIDEQHRFGVQQRALLRAKAAAARPDMLVMTATPIPRTLAMTLYGDLRVSVIDELPPGRKPVTTRVVGAAQREAAHRIIEDELARGRQSYVVFPLVEASEKIDLGAATEAAEDLARRFRPRAVGLLHGRMSSEEKASVMERFAKNEIAVLVSTTVIEVGVDVPNATVMVVEHAERFGLSQIHQLRGRIGRGTEPGHCVLILGTDAEEARERVRVLEETSDGFEVAERDLAMRGPGEMLGTRQAGLPDLLVADLLRDARVLERSREEAFRIVEVDPDLAIPDNRALRAELERRFRDRIPLADVG